MRRTVLALFFSFLATSLAASTKSSEAIIRVLNTRSAGSHKVYEQAVEIVAADAKAGKPIQQFLIALLSVEKDAPAAARISPETRARYLANSRDRIFEMARSKNNAMAWYLLSLEKNDMTVLKHAADLGNIQALNTYATIKMSEALELEATSPVKSAAAMKECFDSYIRTAKENDANGLNSLGMCYQKGYGCKKNDEAAFRCFFKAAEMRHPEAVNNLGRFYLEGIFVPEDAERALKCFEISSTLGNAWGTINFATAVLTGRGCRKDHARAIAILEKSAAQGSVEVMDFLSKCYSTGIGGMKKDAYKAMLWRLRARAARGDESAQEWLKVNKAEL